MFRYGKDVNDSVPYRLELLFLFSDLPFIIFIIFKRTTKYLVGRILCEALPFNVPNLWKFAILSVIFIHSAVFSLF